MIYEEAITAKQKVNVLRITPGAEKIKIKINVKYLYYEINMKNTQKNIKIFVMKNIIEYTDQMYQEICKMT